VSFACGLSGSTHRRDGHGMTAFSLQDRDTADFLKPCRLRLVRGSSGPCRTYRTGRTGGQIFSTHAPVPAPPNCWHLWPSLMFDKRVSRTMRSSYRVRRPCQPTRPLCGRACCWPQVRPCVPRKVARAGRRCHSLLYEAGKLVPWRTDPDAGLFKKSRGSEPAMREIAGGLLLVCVCLTSSISFSRCDDTESQKRDA
jgi:hypothetical protein